jgi:glutamate N-acetyltransferase/amino-acid N-acetyltransferase
MSKFFNIPSGFSFYTANSGEKTNPQNDDLLAIVSENDFLVSGMFTQNTFVGAPVSVSKTRLEKNSFMRGILINSGVANVATGKKGIEDAKICGNFLAKSLKCDEEKILISSTGKIGEFLPMKKFSKLIPELIHTEKKSVEAAAKAIMTTDTVPKFVSKKCGNGNITAIAKGVGMIEPNMATMLAFVLTDIKISPEKIDKLWKRVVDKTFNMVSVDGCESTSDMALFCSSNQCEANETELEKTLMEVCETLTKKIARDGEGATMLLSVECQNVRSFENAKTLAKSVVNSNLFKCAIHGKDLNWGRIMQALGSTHLNFSPEKIRLFINEVCIFQNNQPQKISDQQEAEVFASDEIFVRIDFDEGNFDATAWGCDLSHEYVNINAEYRT